MPKEAKEEHLQEFIKDLKEELKKEKISQDPRIERMLSRRKMPPSLVLSRLSRFGKRNRMEMEEETWISLARVLYEQWEREKYPEEEPVP
jgi:hypothetical protein